MTGPFVADGERGRSTGVSIGDIQQSYKKGFDAAVIDLVLLGTTVWYFVVRREPEHEEAPGPSPPRY